MTAQKVIFAINSDELCLDETVGPGHADYGMMWRNSR
jgi:hypothetical protein